jgi:hypothetical protein
MLRRKHATKKERDQLYRRNDCREIRPFTSATGILSRFAFAQEVWPQLSLHDQHGAGLMPSVPRASSASRMESRRRSLPGCEKRRARDSVRARDRRDDERVMRKLLFQTLCQRSRRLSLTNETQCSQITVSRCPRNGAEALA